MQDGKRIEGNVVAVSYLRVGSLQVLLAIVFPAVLVWHRISPIFGQKDHLVVYPMACIPGSRKKR